MKRGCTFRIGVERGRQDRGITPHAEEHHFLPPTFDTHFRATWQPILIVRVHVRFLSISFMMFKVPTLLNHNLFRGHGKLI